MGDIGNAIKYLYEKFLLRDLLSFITPGAIVVLTAFLILLPEPTLKDSLEKLFGYSASMHWLLYIPLFGVFFAVGFAVQCFGRLIGLIRIHRLDKSFFGQRINIFFGSLAEKSDIYKCPREKVVDFLNVTGYVGWARQQHERSVVLKQMCANNSFAIIITGVFIGIYFCQCQCAKIGIVSFVAFMLLVSLFWGYRDSEIAVNTYEDKVKSLSDKRELQEDK